MERLTSRPDLHDIPYASRYDIDVELPKYQIPSDGVAAKVAYQLLHDELLLGESTSLLPTTITSGKALVDVRRAVLMTRR